MFYMNTKYIKINFCFTSKDSVEKLNILAKYSSTNIKMLMLIEVECTYGKSIYYILNMIIN